MDLTSIPLDVVMGASGLDSVSFDLAAVVQSVIAGAIGLFVASMKRNLQTVDASIMNLAVEVKALGKTDASLALDVKELQVRIRTIEMRCDREQDRRDRTTTGEHKAHE